VEEDGSLSKQSAGYATPGTFVLKGSVTNAAAYTAIAVDNSNSLSFAGSKLFSYRNATVEKAYVDPNGLYYNVTGVWDDVQGPITQAGGAAALTYEAYRDTAFFTYFMRNNQDDTLFLTYQMPHSWDPTTSVKPHMHVIPMVDPASTEVVRITGKYAWAQVGVELPADTSWTAFTVDTNIGTTDAFKEKIIGLATVSPPASPRESNVLVLWVRRPGSSDAADTYSTGKADGTAAANLCVLSIDTHYQKQKLGSFDEIP
jgi:hypothetical protein